MIEDETRGDESGSERAAWVLSMVERDAPSGLAGEAWKAWTGKSDETRTCGDARDTGQMRA